MFHDYRPAKKAAKKKTGAINSVAKTKQKRELAFNSKLFFSAILAFLVILLLYLAIKVELNNFFKLKEDSRILLLKDNKALAILFFNVNNKQLVLTNLEGANIDLSVLNQEASLSSDLKRNVIYSFVFGTSFDQSLNYPSANIDRESLMNFFKDQKLYYSFLKDKELLFKEQSFENDNLNLIEPVFNCPVALINTTTETGLANSLASILEKSAFSIIKKDSNRQDLAQTKIFYDASEASCALVLKKINKILPDGVIEANQQETHTHRAAMVIYIGRDLADLYVFFVNLFHR